MVVMRAEKGIFHFAIFWVVIATLLSVVGCAGNQAAAVPDTETKVPTSDLGNPSGSLGGGSCAGKSQPLLLGIAQDKTKSTQSDPTPQLKQTDLLPFYDLLRCKGGELAFTVISDRANKNLLRLRVEEPPLSAALVKPEDPNPLVNAEKMDEYNKNKNSDGAKRRGWEETTQKAIQTFQDQIGLLLAMPASATRTDFFGALQELEVFEREPRPSWGEHVRHFLLVVSDAEDNVHKSPPSLNGGTQFLLVFGGNIPKSISAMHPIRFENVESAVRYIVNLKE